MNRPMGFGLALSVLILGSGLSTGQEPDSTTQATTKPQRPRRSPTPIVLGPDDKAAFPAAPGGFDKLRDGIAHGKVESVEYPSVTVGNKRKMLVYTPPGYSADHKYPVLYLLHGIGGDEEEWHKHGKPEVILDNLLADRIIMPNDRAEGNVYGQAKAFETFEADLLKDVIPFIDAKYAVKPGRDNRAIAVLSMGGGQALNFGLGNKEKGVPHVWHVDSGPHSFPVWKNDLYLFDQ